MVDAWEVAEVIDKTAPFSAAMEWDNVGVLLDCGNQTDCVLFALDVTPETLLEAERLGCGVLVTHHPVVMEPIKVFGKRDMVVLAAQMGISLVAAHTCFDVADGGVNDVLCALLSLQDVRQVGELARGGLLAKPMSEEDFARYVKTRLDCETVSVVAIGREIQKVAVLGGSGGESALIAADAGYDALVTGEAKHHEALAAKTAGICVVCAGHFKTENPAMEYLRKETEAALGRRAACLLSRDGADPFTFF